MCILPEWAGPDSDTDLTKVDLETETCSSWEANESQNENAATAELDPKHASITHVCIPDIDCLKPSLKARACGFRVGLNSGQMNVTSPSLPLLRGLQGCSLQPRCSKHLNILALPFPPAFLSNKECLDSHSSSFNQTFQRNSSPSLSFSTEE